MVSPQKENGFTAIANEILEAIAKVNLPAYETSILFVILRKTYGFQKKVDWIANSQFVEETGINKGNVSRAIRSLKEKEIVICIDNKLGINKHYCQWKVIWRDNSCYLNRQQKLSPEQPQKKKETITKEISEDKSSQSKKNDMGGFNNRADDYLEGDIDLDGDGTIQGEVKTRTRKYPNAPAVRKVFQEVLALNPSNWRINKTQLLACENLYTERGIDKIKRALEFYKEYQNEEFCPTVSSPYDLDSKWSKLLKFKKDHGD